MSVSPIAAPRRRRAWRSPVSRTSSNQSSMTSQKIWPRRAAPRWRSRCSGPIRRRATGPLGHRPGGPGRARPLRTARSPRSGSRRHPVAGSVVSPGPRDSFEASSSASPSGARHPAIRAGSYADARPASAFSDERLQITTLEPLDVSELHRLLSARLELELARPELVEIRRISGGNPYFALELAREHRRIGGRRAADKPMRVPSSLQELLGDRLSRLPEEVLRILLAAAALPQPTAEMVCAGCADREVDWTAWRLLRVQGSSRSTVPRPDSSIPCSRPSATSARFPGSVGRSTCGSLLRARTSSSARVTSLSGPRAPTSTSHATR